MSEQIFPDVVLRTERLTLRAPSEQDADAIVVACTDEITQQWLPLPRPYRREHAVGFVTEFAPAVRTGGAGIVRTIEYDGEPAGMIDIKGADWRSREAEIGYWAAPAFRGRGVLTEATVALARWALTDMAFERIVLRVATGNRASIRVAEKAGFSYEGTARNAGVVHDGRVDLRVYSLIPADLTSPASAGQSDGAAPIVSSVVKSAP